MIRDTENRKISPLAVALVQALAVEDDPQLREWAQRLLAGDNTQDDAARADVADFVA